MTRADVLRWFEELESSKPKEFLSSFSLNEAAAAWRTTAASALSAAFPPHHRVLLDWDRATEPKWPKSVLNPHQATDWERARWNAICGVFASAHAQLRKGRIEGFIDSVRAEAEGEVLDQAAALLDGGFLAAAAVLAGGALEVHLRRLCDRNNLSLPSGHGSIEKYNAAIAQARNGGVVIYEKPEQSSVTSWGQLRNEAAHDPSRFMSARTKADVRPMIEGVRFFIGKTR